MIQIARDDEPVRGFVCIIEYDGISVSRQRLRAITMLETVLERELDEFERIAMLSRRSSSIYF